MDTLLRTLKTADFGDDYNFDSLSGMYGSMPWRLFRDESGKNVLVLGEEGVTCDFTSGENPSELPWNKFSVDVIETEGTIRCHDYLACLFYNQEVEKIDLSGFDTSDVTQMGRMFDGCNKLRELNVSSFDTSKVAWMDGMFNGCSSLTELDLHNFDTKNVISMKNMFQDCTKLTDLDVSSFDTANVTYMENMFAGCCSLQSINVSSFDTSNVTEMGGMFCDCRNLKSLDLSNFDTHNVSSMGLMFRGCAELKSVDVSSFDTSCVTGMECMFYDCPRLESLDVSSFDTSNVIRMKTMFYDCMSLKSLDLSSFDTSNVMDMDGMFSQCRSLEFLDMSNFRLNEKTYHSNYMFDGCNKLCDVVYKDDKFSEPVSRCVNTFDAPIMRRDIDSVKRVNIPGEQGGKYMALGFHDAKTGDRFAVVVPEDPCVWWIDGKVDHVVFGHKQDRFVMRDKGEGTRYVPLVNIKRRILDTIRDNEEIRSDLRREMQQQTESLNATAEEKGLVTSADVDNDLEV